ncbi:6-phosphogluconolactonase [Chthoniobacter flavus Ellin428]|uniref:6-phosphogluconolactonase n=1 Tax=Chthoniobacter flavus Ellin428 TaxID=497964 RepID=B4CZ00_9BACT|nr:lactonase family protein [Chthoniobacter flavus]EDY20691.1 6-phosphogluconolactonase [Chthoniobacter flavus Ellin428]TCO89589.1 6-phosphogluconolactonase [Chthoniobacter flavus]
MKFPSLASAVGVLALFASTGLATEDFYVGTYTKFFGSKGIYRFQFDEKSGAVSPGQLAVKTVSPSWVIIHPNRRWVYSVNEGPEGKVSAFRIAPDGQLQLLSQQSAKGADPCHLSLDQTHRFLFVANYTSGSVASLPVQRNGALAPVASFQQQHGGGVNKDRQEGPHAHSIYPGPANNFIYSCDLGNDHIERYRFNEEKGTLTPVKTPAAKIAPGSGPRHLVLDPRGFAYLVNEMGNTVTVLRWDKEGGTMHTIQTVPTLPKDFSGQNTTAEIALHPNGHFLYASNRGHNSIAVFAVGENGRLSFVEHASTKGKTPRNFAFDPTGRWLLAANQDSNDIFVYRVNSYTGKLTPTAQRVRVGAPVCVAFVQGK